MPSKIAVINSECVACGSCVNVCPKRAIHVAYGITARVDAALCVGCGVCARTCPAGVITILERGGAV